VDHQEAGVRVRSLQGVVALVVVVLAVGGAAYAARSPRSFEVAATGQARSGAWLCPHGGGPEGWEVFLQIANPGQAVASVRIRTLGEGRPTEPEAVAVEPGSSVRVPVEAEGRGRASVVEWFGQWVAVGWLAHAGGGEGGVAAEPCAPRSSATWYLPDGTTETEGSNDFVIVMNPFARQAVFSITLLSERRDPVKQGALTDVTLRPFRSVAVRLNAVVLGERSVSTLVEVSVGRVAASTLGVSGTGGIRAAIGYPELPPSTLTYPGGADAGRTELVVMNADRELVGAQRALLSGEILGTEGAQAFAGLPDVSVPPGSARTVPGTTSGPASVLLTVSGGEGASVRRTFGVASDQAAVTGAGSAASWIVLPSVAGEPSNPGLVLANPGSEPAVITLAYLAPGRGDPVTITLAPGTTAQAPKEFRLLAPRAAVLAAASSGTFVAAAASYSLGREGFGTYAAALGVPLPAGST
jgi:hypothetical protein